MDQAAEVPPVRGGRRRLGRHGSQKIKNTFSAASLWRGRSQGGPAGPASCAGDAEDLLGPEQARRELIIADGLSDVLGEALAELEHLTELAAANANSRAPPPSCGRSYGQIGTRAPTSHARPGATWAAGPKRTIVAFWSWPLPLCSP
jgi:murein DD-endopeptidase MepM/ murein hydrolase activator NlpD